MRNKICVIGVYFGKLPNYFSLWVKSCKSNPTIDFLLFTDNIIEGLPKNVISYRTTLQYIKTRASEILDFEVCLERPYKLCDYKPLYGNLFRDYISSYDYWGHCDFDLIFGDLASFFKKNNLYQYDRFNALGHLSFYRNTDTVNNYYKLDGGQDDYKSVFTTDSSCIFDEMPGMTAMMIKNNKPIFTKQIYADIATVYDRYRIIDEYKLDKRAKNYPYQIFYWENGKCYRSYFVKGKLYTESLQYIHFKKRPNYSVNFDADRVEAFYITKFGFFPKEGEVTRKIIDKYNPYKGALYERMELCKFRLKHYYRSLKRRWKNRGQYCGTK